MKIYIHLINTRCFIRISLKDIWKLSIEGGLDGGLVQVTNQAWPNQDPTLSHPCGVILKTKRGQETDSKYPWT